MKKIIKKTITIGIPAYNEEGNIATLIRGLMRQKQISYTISSIMIKCDGCTDNTAEIVRKLQKKYPVISLEDSPVRMGKAFALNKIYSEHKSDYLLTVDADLMFAGIIDIENMVREIESDTRLNVVGPRHIPVPQSTIWGKFAYVSFLSFEDAFLRWKNGNNYYALMSATLIRSKFAKSFQFPTGTVSDQCYLYAKATARSSFGFKLVKSSGILFQPVSTFMDWRLLGVRSVKGDKEDLIEHFGKKILPKITIPKHLVYTSLMKWMLRDPVNTLGSILMNMFIRKFPYTKMSLERGIWQTTMSAKKAITMKI